MNNYFRIGESSVEAHGVLEAYISKGSPVWELVLMIKPFPEESGGPEAPCLAILGFPKELSESLNPWLKFCRHQFDDTGAFYWGPCGDHIGAEMLSAELWRGLEHAPGVLSFKGGGLVDSGAWLGTGLFRKNVPVLFSVDVTCDTICCLDEAAADGVSDLADIRRIFGVLPLSPPEDDLNGNRIYKVML